jgi:hypothetical protein
MACARISLVILARSMYSAVGRHTISVVMAVYYIRAPRPMIGLDHSPLV